MNALITLVVEDERHTLDHLCELVNLDADLTLLKGCKDPQEAKQVLDTSDVDLLLLDIQLPGQTGVELLESLDDVPPAVIFITAHDEFAVTAFELNVVDYLLKPFHEKRFQQAITRAKQRIRDQASSGIVEQLQSTLLEQVSPSNPPTKAETPLHHLAVKTPDRTLLIAVDDIDWIESKGNYALLHVDDKVHRIRKSLQQLAQDLDQHFARIHRSYIVNLKQIKELHPLFHGEFTVLLLDGTRLKLSRHYKVHLEEKLGLSL